MNGLERLHFFDGQRLVAKDLELEQKYHMRVRRLLNHGLYSAGVVNGLEVSQVDLWNVKVSAGLSLDPRGREMILLSDAVLRVPGGLPTPPMQGYYLVIQYSEEAEPGTLADCRQGVGTTPPARIKEYPTISWTETWPDHQYCGVKGHPADCAVVLALVILDKKCQVIKIESAVRQYARSTMPPQVQPFALEGEKDIDNANPKVVHFQIRGGLPDSAVLFLWAGAISSLFYTELGSHAHGVGVAGTGATASDLGNHTHAGNDGQADPAGTHNHEIRITGVNVGGLAAADTFGFILDPGAGAVLNVVGSFLGDPSQNDAILTGADPSYWFGSNALVSRGPASGPNQGDPRHDYIQTDGVHTHKVTGLTTTTPNPNQATAHKHTLTGSVALAGNTAPLLGSTPYQARDGKPALSYPDAVHVKVDGNDITALILTKLGWTQLGDGSGNHAFVTSGTGAIDLVQLGVPLLVGPHTVEIRVNQGGGKVLYNLYVE